MEDNLKQIISSTEETRNHIRSVRDRLRTSSSKNYDLLEDMVSALEALLLVTETALKVSQQVVGNDSPSATPASSPSAWARRYAAGQWRSCVHDWQMLVWLGHTTGFEMCRKDCGAFQFQDRILVPAVATPTSTSPTPDFDSSALVHQIMALCYNIRQTQSTEARDMYTRQLLELVRPATALRLMYTTGTNALHIEYGDPPKRCVVPLIDSMRGSVVNNLREAGVEII